MDNVATLIMALFGGAAAALVGGYFARPKTKGEAAQANANASVSLSSDAREWAQLWMTKSDASDRRAEAADGRTHDAEERLDTAEVRIAQLEAKLTAAILYMELLQHEIIRLDGHVPEMPQVLRDK